MIITEDVIQLILIKGTWQQSQIVGIHSDTQLPHILVSIGFIIRTLPGT